MLRTVSTTDYHTAGEPFRIVADPPVALPGVSVADRRVQAAGSPDAQGLRELLCFEPRGHADMYGGFVVPPDDDGACLGVLFWHRPGCLGGGHRPGSGPAGRVAVTVALRRGHLRQPRRCHRRARHLAKRGGRVPVSVRFDGPFSGTKHAGPGGRRRDQQSSGQCGGADRRSTWPSAGCFPEWRRSHTAAGVDGYGPSSPEVKAKSRISWIVSSSSSSASVRRARATLPGRVGADCRLRPTLSSRWTTRSSRSMVRCD